MLHLPHAQQPMRLARRWLALTLLLACAFVARISDAHAQHAALPTYIAIVEDAPSGDATHLRDWLAHALATTSIIAPSWRDDVWNDTPDVAVPSVDIRAVHADVASAWLDGDFDEALRLSAAVSKWVCSTSFATLRHPPDGPSWTALALLRISVLLVEERTDEANTEARCLATQWQTRDGGLSTLYPEAMERITAHRHALRPWANDEWARARTDTLDAFGGVWWTARVSTRRGKTSLRLSRLDDGSEYLLCDIPRNQWSSTSIQACVTSPDPAAAAGDAPRSSPRLAAPPALYATSAATLTAGIVASAMQASTQRQLNRCSAGVLNPCRGSSDATELRQTLHRRQAVAITTWSLALTATATTAILEAVQRPSRRDQGEPPAGVPTPMLRHASLAQNGEQSLAND